MSNYKDYGFPDDNPSHAFFYLRDKLVSLLDKNKNNCILDLGCGNGYLVNYLLARGYNIYGTDASEDGIVIAKKEHPNRFFLQDLSTDALPLELEKHEFDTIISTEVIEHLYDPIEFIKFCKKTLGNSGEIILSTPYHGYFKNLGISLFNKWDDHMSPLWQGGHIKLWSKKSLTCLLNEAGFTVTAFKGCGRFPFFWKSMVIKARILE